jgi:hypothetical protein
MAEKTERLRRRKLEIYIFTIDGMFSFLHFTTNIQRLALFDDLNALLLPWSAQLLRHQGRESETGDHKNSSSRSRVAFKIVDLDLSC